MRALRIGDWSCLSRPLVLAIVGRVLPWDDLHSGNRVVDGCKSSKGISTWSVGCLDKVKGRGRLSDRQRTG